MRLALLAAALLAALSAAAQKKPVDHSVYDNWQSIGERLISNDGKYSVFTINAQDGDGYLVIHDIAANSSKQIPRGYNAVITEDSRYLVFKIKPPFAETRQARIKKKKPDDMPKDSIAIAVLGQDSLWKMAKVKTFKTPEKGAGWVAYHLEKAAPEQEKKKSAVPDSNKIKLDMLVKLADSVIRRSVDSVKNNITREEVLAAAEKAAKEILKKGTDEAVPMTDADAEDAAAVAAGEGTDLVLRSLETGKTVTFKYVSEYYFSKKANVLLLETTRFTKDTNSVALVLWHNLATGKTDTVMKKCNDCRGYAMDEEGTQVAFTAERDSSSKALVKLYKLWYYQKGADSATIAAEKITVGMPLGSTVSENGNISFSRDGKKLFFGTAPIKPAKDTTLIDFELARLDVWHYNDDYVQPRQLKQLDAELRRSYLAVTLPGSGKMVQLGAADAEEIRLADEGNADWVLAETDKGNRVESQWNGATKSTGYIISTTTGQRKTVATNLYTTYLPSPSGRYVYWYNPAAKNYFIYNVATGAVTNISAKVKKPLYDEENDVPADPQPYGVMAWDENDRHVYVNTHFDVWMLDPDGKAAPVSMIDPAYQSVKKQVSFQLLNTKRYRRFITPEHPLYFRIFDFKTKYWGYAKMTMQYDAAAQRTSFSLDEHFLAPYLTNGLVRAQAAEGLIFFRERFELSPEMMYTRKLDINGRIMGKTNPQQDNYTWGTAELFRWKTYDGKPAEGCVFKPEGFDSTKKYPSICYFYEVSSESLYQYIAPSPTPSRLNIPYFVSNGYVVFVPDIRYTTGHPGNDAYNYIVSGTRALVKKGYLDSTRIGIQGQSWGGYQVAHLITRTNLFRAAWAGAPVVNMTSAYGGIRWESGVSRQFQYEKGQSRIGATLWEKPQLYMENSPLFYLNKTNTPVVIMSNDNDGAVPWYQGIEMYTALRRLGKKVWMLNYNNEAHNLVERRNRKDIQIREQQFFDWLLKDAKPAKWLKDGVPATLKGIDWGLKTE